jgi:hypothetical protein
MDATTISLKRGAYSTFDEIETLIRGFESGTLPRAQWTHSAHIAVAGWYLVCYPEAEATRRIREGIQNYNRAVGIITTNEGGYHETITLFWIRMVRDYLSKVVMECPVVYLIGDLVDHFSDKNLPFEYYNRDRLMSWEARAAWLEPDLKPIPCRKGRQGEKSCNQ